MPSRRILVVLVLSATLFGGGCAKENQISAPAISIEGGGANCFTDASTQLDNFMNGQSSAGDVSAFFDCSIQEVNNFEELTTGTGPNGSYGGEAIVRFMHDFLSLRDLQLSSDQLAALMEVKRVVLGGDNQELSRTELDRLRGFLQQAKSVALTVRPYAAILFAGKAKNETDLINASQALNTALGQLGLWLQSRNQTYTAAQLQALAAAFGNSTLQEIAALVPPIKALLLPTGQADITGAEWPQVAQLIAQGLTSEMEIAADFQNGLNSGLNSDELPAHLQALTPILRQAIAAHANQTIPLAEWDGVFQAIARTFPSWGSASALHNLWMLADCRLLSNAATCSGDFGAGQLALLTSELSDWSDLLQFSRDGLANTALRQRFLALLDQSGAMKWDGEGRMLFPIPDSHPWVTNDVHRMVWPFVAIDWVKTAYYGRDPQTLTADQVTAIANEVLPVLHSWGWLMDTDSSVANSIVREADLFTLPANGDGQLDLGEAVRYLGFVASAYQASEDWLNTAQKICGSHDVACVRQVGLRPEVMTPMPRFLKWMRSQSKDEFTRYMQAAEVIALDHTQSGEVQIGDLLQVWMVFQYMETFMMRFDTDHSETISLSEAWKAFRTLGSGLTGAAVMPASLIEMDRDTLLQLLKFISQL